jgi:hypothetical protein
MSLDQMPNEIVAESNLPSTVKQKWNIKSIMLSIMVLGLLGTWGYIIWDKNNVREMIQQKDANAEALTKKRDLLQKDLEDVIKRYDEIKSVNIQKDSVIIVRDQDIAKKQKRINILMSKQQATAADLAEAKSIIESLKNDINGYEQEITALKLKNSELNSMNDKLIEQRDKVRKDLDSSVQEIKNREEIIDVGSTLQASNFNIMALDAKKSGKVVETSKAKKVDKLRISFDLDENLITKTGAKKLFIIMTDPSGKVIVDPANGSGVLKTRDGNEKQYTQVMDVNYIQNKRQTVSFDWAGTGKFEKGAYKIEVFQNGFKIGEGQRPIK